MKTRVVLPKWGMGIEEGTVVRWLKTIGDKIDKGEPLVEIETAKATQEVEAPVGGTLVEILLPEGQTAPANDRSRNAVGLSAHRDIRNRRAVSLRRTQGVAVVLA